MDRRCSLTLLLASSVFLFPRQCKPDEKAVPSLVHGAAPTADWTVAKLESFLKAADKVELVFNQGYPDDRAETERRRDKAVLGKRDNVNRFCSEVKLVAKEACNCDHVQMIVFWNGSQKIEVSICDHCFDIMLKDGTIRCRMPKALYDSFKKIEDDRETAKK